MNAFIKFNSGTFRLPIAVRLWLALLLSVNLVVPVGYLQRSEARSVLLAFRASCVLMVLITHTIGFTRLMGWGHLRTGCARQYHESGNNAGDYWPKTSSNSAPNA